MSSLAKNLFPAALAVFLIGTGCKKTLDINQDPNNPAIEQGTPTIVFPAGVMSTAGRVGGDMAILGGIWAQYWTQSATANQYKYIDAYNVKSADFNGAYNELFSGALNDYQFVIRKAREQQNWKYLLMGTVMRAYTYQVLVDLYDRVPYSEAFQGLNNLQPRFEDGYTVYQGLLAELDSALATDYRSGSFSERDQKADLLFGGDMEKWTQFANTLRLKMFLRMVNKKPAEAEAGIRALYTAGANFLSEDAAVTGFSDAPDKSNPMYEYNVRNLNVQTNLRASRTLLTYLLAKGDPRRPAYYTNSTGINQGDYATTSTTAQNAGVVIQDPTEPVRFISGAESYFLQAEALERYFGGSGAQALYDRGVQAAFDQVGVSAAGFVGGTYAYPSGGSFDQKLEAIITQKWISFFGSHALEGFFEKNRTGYPRTSAVYSDNPAYVPGQFVVSRNAVTNGQLPKRLVYPDVERNRNNNTPAEVPITAPVWWAL
ncbi:SusD/RagB family nutrient-binding outer membrane lipoprotein [Flaviaesturariibacter aridisoli]|uniref:SusD/RagB family nutrient-binding outer membrane lipoprotein n=1 Tax=Flaviaesturariibacter aridisoli TaxID=2545761 RepID=A0A4R4DTW9_9BACT|nr:SusD/RagB family nutrient-binding outer membrane lipoprotein [Flaviaesturariibacter aridisoli]TCZ66527.1 SusD/RagB family nutrient-binding outer membrane lipoprotein [Flaviaesturariibacter aridisoli]